MKFLSKSYLAIAILIISIGCLNAQNGNSNNTQNSNKQKESNNDIVFKLKCSDGSCGFEIVNSNNQVVAVIRGDGSWDFASFLENISWNWRYQGNILFNILATTNAQSINMNTPVIINTSQTRGDTVFSVMYNNSNLFEIGHNAIYGNAAQFNTHVNFYGIADFNNQVYFNNNVCFYGWYGSCSDVRLKKNIKPIENALDKVLRLNGVTFQWRGDENPDYKFNEGTNIGLIAQEVEKVMPELVVTQSNGIKSIAYANITAVLAAAIKEQQQIIDTQKKQIQVQTLEINNLSNQINAIKNDLVEQKKEITKLYSILRNK